MKKNHDLIEHRFAYVFLILCSCFFSCKDFIEVDAPKSDLVTNSVFTNQATTKSAVTAMYSTLHTDGTGYSYSLYAGLYSDELRSYSVAPTFQNFYTNSLDGLANNPGILWNSAYKVIYMANSIIEGCEASNSLREADKNQFIAEAKFMRAWQNFYLTNFYGDAPLVLTTDYKENSGLYKSSQEQIYQSIKSDLEDARAKIATYYVSAKNTQTTTERLRPNKGAVQALLARVHLFTKDYKSAAAMATEVIDQKALYDTVALDKVFLINSKEAIWQIAPSTASAAQQTREGLGYVLVAVPTVSALSAELVASFETHDQRKSKWIGRYTATNGTVYNYAFKYKDRTTTVAKEYSTVMRLGEVYLIRAEARAFLDDLPGALSDLNVIRKRAGLTNLTATTQSQLLNLISKERRLELFTEYAHRWLDIKRSDNKDQTMLSIAQNKGGIWESYKQYWPLAQTEIDRSQNLKQTQGY